MQNAAERTWAVFMTAGGHFAGAIVRVSHAEDEETNKDEGTKKKKQKRPKPDIEVLKHKTFHRYTSQYWIFFFVSVSSFFHLLISPQKARRLSVVERQCKG